MTHWAAVWSTRITPVPLLLTGVRLHPPGRTDKHLCRCFGAPATHARRPHGRVFPDHLIIFAKIFLLLTYFLPSFLHGVDREIAAEIGTASCAAEVVTLPGRADAGDRRG